MLKLDHSSKLKLSWQLEMHDEASRFTTPWRLMKEWQHIQMQKQLVSNQAMSSLVKSSHHSWTASEFSKMCYLMGVY
jgi:hypothetical protein